MPGTNKEFPLSGNLCDHRALHRPPPPLSPAVGGRCWLVLSDWRTMKVTESAGTEQCQACWPGSPDQYPGLSGPSTSTTTINTHEKLTHLSTSGAPGPGLPASSGSLASPASPASISSIKYIYIYSDKLH